MPIDELDNHSVHCYLYCNQLEDWQMKFYMILFIIAAFLLFTEHSHSLKAQISKKPPGHLVALHNRIIFHQS